MVYKEIDMPKLIQILLSKQLTVNLGRDEQGQAKTVVLQACRK
jgi:hypothetical protein